MSSLFSSPSKEASSAAAGSAAATDAEVQKVEDYVTKAQQNTRDAIAGLPASPYLAAAGNRSTAPYAVDPNNTVGFTAPPVPQGNPFGTQPAPQTLPMPGPANNPFVRPGQSTRSPL